MQTTSNQITQNIPILFPEPGSYYIQLKYISADGNLVLETATKEVVYKID